MSGNNAKKLLIMGALWSIYAKYATISHARVMT